MRVGIALAMSSLPLAAQQWQLLPGTQHPPIRTSNHALAFDPIRQRLVCATDTRTSATPFGSSGELSLYEWDGSRWFARGAASAFATTFERQAIAFDPTRGGIVTLDRLATTRLYDGASWRVLATGSRGIDGASLCFDAARQVLVAVQNSEIFELQGLVWVPRAVVPNPNFDRRACFDPISGKVLIFGGFSGTHDATTWTWDGTTVAAVTTQITPPGRIGHALAFDPAAGRVVLAGGKFLAAAPVELDQVHTWTGTDWVPETPLPRPMYGAAAGAFGGRLHLFGGMSNFEAIDADLLQRGPGGTWTPLPIRSAGAFAAHDTARARTVSIHGGRTMEFDGHSWTDPGIPFPGTAAVVGMAFHAATSHVVAIDTQCTVWTFAGTSWTARPSANQPPPRLRATVCYDPVRARTVLFGWPNDLWEWDGTTWSQQPTPPLTGQVNALGSDGNRLAAVVDSTLYLRNPSGFVPAVGDPLPQHILSVRCTTAPDGLWLHVATLQTFSTNGDATYHLVGDSLVRINSSPALQSAIGPMVFDTNLGRIVMHDDYGRRDFVLTPTPASMLEQGAGCHGGQAQPRLIAASLPQLGTSAVLDVVGADPGRLAFLMADFAGATVPLGGGCSRLLANPVVVATTPTNSGGFASSSFPLPWSPSLRGVNLHYQAAVFTPNGALLGLADLTAAVRLLLGD